MDPVDFKVFCVAVKTLSDGFGGLTGPWVALKVAGELLDMLRSRPCLLSSPEIAMLEEEAKVECHTALTGICNKFSSPVMSPPVIQFNSIQVIQFIYIVPNYNNCHLKAL